MKVQYYDVATDSDTDVPAGQLEVPLGNELKMVHNYFPSMLHML